MVIKTSIVEDFLDVEEDVEGFLVMEEDVVGFMDVEPDVVGFLHVKEDVEDLDIRLLVTCLLSIAVFFDVGKLLGMGMIDTKLVTELVGTRWNAI